MGKTATHAVVFAQLHMPDGRCHGLHSFLVQVSPGWGCPQVDSYLQPQVRCCHAQTCTAVKDACAGTGFLQHASVLDHRAARLLESLSGAKRPAACHHVTHQ